MLNTYIALASSPKAMKLGENKEIQAPNRNPSSQGLPITQTIPKLDLSRSTGPNLKATRELQ